MYVADTNNDRLVHLAPDGTLQVEWPGFNSPVGVALDAQGNIYVADSDNHRIQQLSPSGQRVAQWGTFGIDPGQVVNAPFAAATSQDRSTSRIRRTAVFTYWGRD
jgi:DNA-binding beta-propeller fold protein YncE